MRTAPTSASERDAAAAHRARRRALRSLLWRMRPWLIGALVTLAALLGLRTFAPPPAAQTVVLVAARDLPAGTDVTGADLRTVALPAEAVPRGAVAPGEPVGVLALTVPEGAVLTASHLAAAGWGVHDGELAVPVRLRDPLAAGLVREGGVLVLVAATGEGASVLTDAARVLAVRADDVAASVLGGSTERASPLLLLAVPRSAATLVLDASAAGTLTVALGPEHRGAS